MSRIKSLVLLAGALLPAAAAGEVGPAATEQLTLEECVQFALEHSPLLDEARAGVAVMQARQLQADWAWFPKLKVDSIFTGPTSEARLRRMPTVNDPSVFSRDPRETGSIALEGSSGDGELNYGDGKLGVMWRFGVEATIPLYTFGKISSLQDAAEHGVQAAIAQSEINRLSLIRDVRKVFFGFQAARAINSVLDDGAAKLAEAEQRVQDSLDEDEDTYQEIDLFKLRVHGSEVHARRAQTRKEMAVALEGMKLLIGWPQDRALTLVKQDLPEDEVVLREVDELLGLTRKDHPAARALESGQNAMEDMVSLRISEFFPDLYLAGGFRYSVDTAAQDISHPFLNDGRNYKSVGALLGLKWKLDIPYHVGQLREAQAERDKLSARRRAALGGLGFKVKESFFEVRQTADALAAYRKARKAGRSWLVSATLNWGVGTLEAGDFIDAIKAYSLGEIAFTRALLDYRSALAELSSRVGLEQGGKAQGS